MNIINGQDVFGAQTLTTNFPMKVIDIDFFSPPQSITLGQEEDHYSTLLHLNINEQSLNGEDDDSLIIYIVIKQDNGNILQYPIYAPEGVLNVTNYGIKISKTEYYFPVVSTMTDHPHNGTIQFRIHAAAMNVDDPEDREGALIAASSKIKYRVDDSIAFNANVPSKFYDRFLEPSSGIVTPEMFQRADNAPQYTDDMLINMALKSNAKVVLMIGDYVLDSPIIIAGPTYQPKTIFHKGSITYTGKKILEKYGRDPDDSNWTTSPYSVRKKPNYIGLDNRFTNNQVISNIDSIIFDYGIEPEISTYFESGTRTICPITKAAIVITNIGSPCKFTFDRIESSGDGIELLSCTIKDTTQTNKYYKTAVQYVNLYFGSIAARYGEKIDGERQTFGSNNSNIKGGKCIYFHLCNVAESQKINGSRYNGEDKDTLKGWLNEIRIFDGRLNSGAYGIYADGIDNSWNKINNIKLQNVALEPNKWTSTSAPSELVSAWVDYTSYLNSDQREWVRQTILLKKSDGTTLLQPPDLSDLLPAERTLQDITNFSKTISITQIRLVDLNNGEYRYVCSPEILDQCTYKMLYKGIYIANGCHRWSFSGLRYAEKPTVPQLIFSTKAQIQNQDQEYIDNRFSPKGRQVTYDDNGEVTSFGGLVDENNYYYLTSKYRTSSAWLLQTEGNIREFLFEGAQYAADNNFSFSNATSGTLIIPKSQDEVIEEESGEDGVTGTYRTAHVFASFRTVTNGVISPFQEAEIPYIEDIAYNVNSLQNYIFPVKELENVENKSIIKDYSEVFYSKKSSINGQGLKTRVFRGDTYSTNKMYASIYGDFELEEGLYKLELETEYNEECTGSLKNIYYFIKSINGIKFLPIKQHSSLLDDFEDWEMGSLTVDEICSYTPVIKKIEHDFITGEVNGESVDESCKDNYILTLKIYINEQLPEDFIAPAIKTNTYRLSYQSLGFLDDMKIISKKNEQKILTNFEKFQTFSSDGDPILDEENNPIYKTHISRLIRSGSYSITKDDHFNPYYSFYSNFSELEYGYYKILLETIAYEKVEIDGDDVMFTWTDVTQQSSIGEQGETVPENLKNGYFVKKDKESISIIKRLPEYLNQDNDGCFTPILRTGYRGIESNTLGIYNQGLNSSITINSPNKENARLKIRVTIIKESTSKNIIDLLYNENLDEPLNNVFSLKEDVSSLGESVSSLGESISSIDNTISSVDKDILLEIINKNNNTPLTYTGKNEYKILNDIPLRTRLIKGETYNSASKSYNFVIPSDVTLDSGFYKIIIENTNPPSDFTNSVTNGYFFYKHDNYLKLISNIPSALESGKEVDSYTPVLYEIEHDYISPETDTVNLNFKNNICVTTKRVFEESPDSNTNQASFSINIVNIPTDSILLSMLLNFVGGE